LLGRLPRRLGTVAIQDEEGGRRAFLAPDGRVQGAQASGNRGRYQEAVEKGGRRKGSRAQIDAYVAAHCTDEQKQRHAAGALPEDEILSARRAAIFAPLDAQFTRHKKILDRDIRQAAQDRGDSGDGDIRYDTLDLIEEIDANEATVMDRICALADQTMADRYETEVRRHWGYVDEEPVFFRPAILVTVQDGDRKFSREYACASH
jgi:hypothetical protein